MDDVIVQASSDNAAERFLIGFLEWLGEHDLRLCYDDPYARQECWKPETRDVIVKRVRKFVRERMRATDGGS